MLSFFGQNDFPLSSFYGLPKYEKKICNSNGSNGWTSFKIWLNVNYAENEKWNRIHIGKCENYPKYFIYDDHFYKIGHPLRQKALLRFTEAVHTEIGSPRCWNKSFVVELSHPHSTTLFDLINNHLLLVECFFSHPKEWRAVSKYETIFNRDNFAKVWQKLPSHIKYCKIILLLVIISRDLIKIIFETFRCCHLFDRDLTSSGVDDEEVAIAGDEQDREGGEEHARRLDRSDQLAENRLESWLLLSTSNYSKPCSGRESNSWWGCRRGWEACRTSRARCQTQPTSRWTRSLLWASPGDNCDDIGDSDDHPCFPHNFEGIRLSVL